MKTLEFVDIVVKDILPTIGIIISVYTLLSLKRQNQHLLMQYGLSRQELKDNHDYNRRLCAYKIVENWDKETLRARTSICNKWPEAFRKAVQIDRAEIDRYHEEQYEDMMRLPPIRRNAPTIYEDMQVMLNYFENLAISIEFGVADEKVLKRAFDKTFQRWYTILGDFHQMILKNRIYNPWRSLEVLHKKWHDPDDDTSIGLTGNVD